MTQIPSNCKYMRSKVNCQIWSEIDFELLNNAVLKFGKDWNKIQEQFFPNRKPNCLKCKYNYYVRKQNQALKINNTTEDNIIENFNINQQKYEKYKKQKHIFQPNDLNTSLFLNNTMSDDNNKSVTDQAMKDLFQVEFEPSQVVTQTQPIYQPYQIQQQPQPPQITTQHQIFRIPEQDDPQINIDEMGTQWDFDFDNIYQFDDFQQL